MTAMLRIGENLQTAAWAPLTNQRDGKRDVVGGADGEPGFTREEYLQGPVRSRIPVSLNHGWY